MCLNTQSFYMWYSEEYTLRISDLIQIVDSSGGSFRYWVSMKWRGGLSCSPDWTRGNCSLLHDSSLNPKLLLQMLTPFKYSWLPQMTCLSSSTHTASPASSNRSTEHLTNHIQLFLFFFLTSLLEYNCFTMV